MRKESLQREAEDNFRKIMEKAGKFFEGVYQNRCLDIADSNKAPRLKYIKLAEVVEEAGSYIRQHSACGRKCHHCCHMSVVITGYEAEIIGEYISMPPASTGVTIKDFVDDSKVTLEAKAKMTTKYMGVDCPFLIAEECSIYDVRPFSCRAHYNLTNDPSICDLTKGDHDVPEVDFKVLWYSVLKSFFKYEIGDIREFFPNVKWKK